MGAWCGNDGAAEGGLCCGKEFDGSVRAGAADYSLCLYGEPAEEAIKNGTDIVSTTQLVELSSQRMMVRDTDKGKELKSQIDELKELLYAYRHGLIQERSYKRYEKF